ncbi:XAC0095 family protein, partial [Coralloluteibacterium thermophilus]
WIAANGTRTGMRGGFFRADYYLPEDSQFRLKKLQQYMAFLSQLAQPRTADEEREWAPEVSVGEVAICLELLAEQVAIVLDEVAWPARLQPAKATPRATEDEDEAAGQATAMQAAPTDGAPAEGDARYTFGITLAQVDALARLVQTVSAHGDVMAVGQVDELAKGTLPQLGQAICDAADALRGILDEVEAQRLGHAPHPRGSVAEARAVYGAGAEWIASSEEVPAAMLAAVGRRTQPPRYCH